MVSHIFLYLTSTKEQIRLIWSDNERIGIILNKSGNVFYKLKPKSLARLNGYNNYQRIPFKIINGTEDLINEFKKCSDFDGFTDD